MKMVLLYSSGPKDFKKVSYLEVLMTFLDLSEKCNNSGGGISAQSHSWLRGCDNGLKLSKKCGNYGFWGIDLTICIKSDTKRTCDVQTLANAKIHINLQA